MDKTGRADDLQKRVKAYREAMGDDLLGATFLELLLRLAEPGTDWFEIKMNTYAFYVQLMTGDPKVAHFFNQGLIAALIDLKEDVENGRSFEDDD